MRGGFKITGINKDERKRYNDCEEHGNKVNLKFMAVDFKKNDGGY